jgi:hypothetical protein
MRLPFLDRSEELARLKTLLARTDGTLGVLYGRRRLGKSRLLEQTGIRCPSSISTPRCRHRSLITSPTCLRTLPYSFFFRYFGTITTWYLQSHLTCAWLVQLSRPSLFPHLHPGLDYR